MATMVSNRRSTFAIGRRSSFGINCVRCNDGLIAPENSEYRHGTHIRHQWHCSNCETSFESLESIPVEAMTNGRRTSCPAQVSG
jgi:hypothetical protein